MRTISAKGLRAAALAGLSLLALAAATAVHAEDKAEATDVDQLVVTAARTILPASALPLTVDVIDSEALTQQVGVSGSIVDAVSTLSPSFSPTRQKLSGAGETLRGRSPLYAINGIPQSTPIRDGSRDGYTIDPFFIDRVEVIYGSNALQGIGATGGVVNQVTVGPPRADGVSGKVLTQVTAGHDLGDSVGGKVAGLVAWRGGALDATAGVAYDARGAYYDADGRRLGMDNTQGDVQDSKALSFFTRLGWQLGDNTRLDVVANRFELKGDGDYVTTTISARNPAPVTNGNRVAHLPTTSFRGVQPGEPAANRVETVSASLTNTDLLGGNLIAQLFFNRSRDTFGGDVNDTFQDVAIAPKGTLFDQSSNRSRKLGARVSYERAVPGIEGLTGTVGVDAINDRTEQVLIETGRAWVPPTKFQSVAPFVQGNLSLLDDKVHLAGGVRFENVELKVDDFTTLAFYGSRKVAGGNPDFKATLANGGIVVEPVHGLRLYGSYAEGYTVPDVGRILRGINIDGVDVDSYLNIEPIVSNNRELGAELKRGPFDASLSYFWSASKLGQLLVKNSGGIFDVQRQRVEIEGLEANVKARTPVPGLVVSAGYAHLKGRTDTNKDNQVDTDLDGANISPDRLNLAADYQGDTWGLRVQIQSYIKRDMQDALVKDNFTGYTLADAFVRYKLPMGALSLGVQNLFNSQYISYNSDTTAPAVDRYFAGRGRTATLGWEARF
ncbi:TonB-dependent receptor [Caulobacter rhizosphaerae]|jgi:iron complex outermembrane receptor protein|uniref:TonB-dependent receptor n=1 Tax=Caulobacter rhizosphaerae TaxID=2010972 RepID=UPI0013D3568A|nr:TonB-dependent receptor [Caulobacter rhizosphaerae]GGL45905.1 TonB-dependent receptor [Caulobacter rhizosphaerae]